MARDLPFTAIAVHLAEERLIAETSGSLLTAGGIASVPREYAT